MRIWFGLGFILFTYGATHWFINERIPVWKEATTQVVVAMEKAKDDPSSWASIQPELDKVPNVYPLSVLHNIYDEGSSILAALEEIKDIQPDIGDDYIDLNLLWKGLDTVESTLEHLDQIERELASIPRSFLETSQISQLEQATQQVLGLQIVLEDIRTLGHILQRFSEKNETVLLLLQNQNEPRSTGGFVGSLAFLHFEGNRLRWDFSDIYALDRLIPLESQKPAPQFFHNLSTTISLRDANFWPDFPTTAKAYRTFLKAADQPAPDTIMAINLHFVENLLKITGPLELQPWGLTADENNIDLVLQFLVESKASGRFEAKKPVEVFAKTLLGKLSQAESAMLQRWAEVDWRSFIERKNLLAHANNRSLQRLFTKWKLDGSLQQKDNSDEFLHLDFVSVGANKSEKFMWTKVWHDSEVAIDGTINNTIQIKRSHSLKPNEVQDLIGYNNLPLNIQELMTPELLWKLGAGENRTVLRLYVDPEAKLGKITNPAGAVTQTWSEDKQFRIYNIPLNVLPGESLNVNLQYKTKINRGSHSWRPYHLQLVGTPGRTKTSLIKTISTADGGKFEAETFNIGRPQELNNQDFRAVITFPEVQ